jgi:hypothetical protein
MKTCIGCNLTKDEREFEKYRNKCKLCNDTIRAVKQGIAIKICKACLSPIYTAKLTYCTLCTGLRHLNSEAYRVRHTGNQRYSKNRNPDTLAITHKPCNRCGKTFEIKDFPIKGKYPTGYCRGCTSALQSESSLRSNPNLHKDRYAKEKGKRLEREKLASTQLTDSLVRARIKLALSRKKIHITEIPDALVEAYKLKIRFKRENNIPRNQ